MESWREELARPPQVGERVGERVGCWTHRRMRMLDWTHRRMLDTHGGHAHMHTELMVAE